jgi:hypothetical protein
MGIGLLGPFLLAPVTDSLPNSPWSFVVVLVFLVTIPALAARLRCPRCHEIVTTGRRQPDKKAIYRWYAEANLWRRLIPPHACPHCGLPTKYHWGRPMKS